MIPWVCIICTVSKISQPPVGAPGAVAQADCHFNPNQGPDVGRRVRCTVLGSRAVPIHVRSLAFAIASAQTVADQW